MKDMEAFLLTLLHSATCAHIQHWQTDNYSKHKALGKYYEQIIELVDDLAESYMGRYDKLGKFDEEYDFDKDPLKYFEGLQKFVIESRVHLPQTTELQNKVDEIMALIDSTTYRLKYLS